MKNCPVCKTISLSQVVLDHQLPGHRCEQCGGVYIASVDYWSWLSTFHETPPESPVDEIPLEAVDRKQAKLCPGCGHLLTPYKIWPNIAFYLDHCGACNGIWCDGHEWDVLARHEQEGKLNLFFTQPWQQKLRETESRKKMEQLFLQRFGPENYARLKEIKSWLDGQKERGAMLAFLHADDPYSVRS